MQRALVTLVIAVTLAIPSLAFGAAAPVDDQYGSPVQGASQSPKVTQVGTVGGLPFTGSELGMITGAGMLVLVAGSVLRRIGMREEARRRDAAEA